MKLWAGIFLAYIGVLALSPLSQTPLNTPTHWILPAVGVLGAYLFGVWLDEYTRSNFSRTLYYLVLLFVLAYVGYLFGVWAFTYTYALFGGGMPGVDALNRLFFFLPYWTLFPGLFFGWLARAERDALFSLKYKE